MIGRHCSGTYTNSPAPWYIAGDGQNSQLGAPSSAVHSVPGYSDPQHDVLLAIMAWVENGTAPNEIVATKFKNDTNPEAGVSIQRPICVFPKRAVYDGKGEVGEASSWNCEGLY